MQALNDLIANAKAAVSNDFDPLHVHDLASLDLTALDKEGMLEMIWSMRRYSSVYRTYIGEKEVTKEQLRDAIISVTYVKKQPAGRKYSGGPRYDVVIDHGMLPPDWDKNTRLQEHWIILTPRKYRGQPKHWIETNIFDGKTIPRPTA